jgi:hypothetical protein
VKDIQRKYFPRAEVPGFLFQRVTALLDLSSIQDTSNEPIMKSMIEAARNDRLAIADLMLRSQGGTTCKYLDNNSQLPPDITHVVVDESNIRNVTALTRAFEGCVNLIFPLCNFQIRRKLI